MKEYKKPKQSKIKKHKHKKVQAYPHWQQIEFDDCVMERCNIKITESLLNARVIQANNINKYDRFVRLKVEGVNADYL